VVKETAAVHCLTICTIQLVSTHAHDNHRFCRLLYVPVMRSRTTASTLCDTGDMTAEGSMSSALTGDQTRAWHITSRGHVWLFSSLCTLGFVGGLGSFALD
jgi:hypothetical protein